METEVAEKQSSYRYWVRDTKGDAAPLPAPKKLSPQDLSDQSQPTNLLGSVWNQAGTWEERNLNTWASSRMKELLSSLSSLELSCGKAEISEVSKCMGDAFLVTVRNKKRVGYTYELTLKFKGEWQTKEEKKQIKGHLDIPEFSFGEVDDLQVEVRFSDDKEFLPSEKPLIAKELQMFLKPIQEKLRQFELELKERHLWQASHTRFCRGQHSLLRFTSFLSFKSAMTTIASPCPSPPPPALAGGPLHQ